MLYALLAGVHIRFRLGGSCFPPILFYKIYTHRPVADIGSFCPRDYCAERLLSSVHESQMSGTQQCSTARAKLADVPVQSRKKAVRHPHLEADFDIPEVYRRFLRWDGSIGLRSTRSWYRRQENNGWRPVNEVRMLDGEDEVPTTHRRPPFHFKASLRREERLRWQKFRHRQWMVALYRYIPP
jgi:hypothetical protein